MQNNKKDWRGRCLDIVRMVRHEDEYIATVMAQLALDIEREIAQVEKDAKKEVLRDMIKMSTATAGEHFTVSANVKVDDIKMYAKMSGISLESEEKVIHRVN